MKLIVDYTIQVLGPSFLIWIFLYWFFSQRIEYQMKDALFASAILTCGIVFLFSMAYDRRGLDNG